MRNLMLVLTASVLLTAVPALGGPLMQNRVSGSANWVAHADYERFNQTLIGKLIREELAKQGLEQKLEDFATVFSFHPLDDVRNVTIYGDGEEQEKAVALIEATCDKNKLVSLVRMNPEYETIEYGNLVVHSWVDEKKQDPNKSGVEKTYGCFFRDDLVILSSGLDTVKHAIDVLKGTSPNAANGVFTQASLSAEGAFFQAAANSVGQIAGQQQQTAVLRQTEKLGMVVGEDMGKFYCDLNLTAKSEEIAKSISQILGGIIAFTALQDQEQPELAGLAKKVQLTCTQNVLQIHFDTDSQGVVTFLKEQWEKKQKQDDAAAQ